MSIMWGETMRGIITADWHIRATRPRCRIDDDWLGTQRDAIKQVFQLAVQKKADIFVVGDIFHANSDTSFACIALVQKLALQLKKKGLRLFILAGNHDLPYHNVENIDRSAVGILLKSENIYSIQEYSEDISAPNFGGEVEDKEIVFRHVLVFPDVNSVPPGCDAYTYKELCEETPNAKYIFTGDYHHSFIGRYRKQTVANPGCLLRQASDFVDYQNVVYFVDTEQDIIDAFPIIDNVQLMDDTYIQKQNEREERISSFVETLANTESVSLDFVDNVEKALLVNDFSEEYKDIIRELLEV